MHIWFQCEKKVWKNVLSTLGDSMVLEKVLFFFGGICRLFPWLFFGSFAGNCTRLRKIFTYTRKVGIFFPASFNKQCCSFSESYCPQKKANLKPPHLIPLNLKHFFPLTGAGCDRTFPKVVQLWHRVFKNYGQLGIAQAFDERPNVAVQCLMYRPLKFWGFIIQGERDQQLAMAKASATIGYEDDISGFFLPFFG